MCEGNHNETNVSYDAGSWDWWSDSSTHTSNSATGGAGGQGGPVGT